MLLIDAAERLMDSDLERAEALAADALALAERAGDGVLEAMAWLRQGNVLHRRGGNAEALALYDRAIAAMNHLGRPVEAARIAISWVWVATRLGRLQEALQVARQARRVLLQNGQLLRVAVLDLNVGSIHREHGRYTAALHCYTAALAMSQSLGEQGRLNAAKCRVNRGLTLVSLGRHREALRELLLARSEHERMGQWSSCARADLSIGLIHLDLGRYREALKAFDAAREQFHNLGLTIDATWASYATADCYLRLNRPVDALAALDAAESDVQSMDGVPYVMAVATRRVAAHLLLDQDAEALVVLDEAGRNCPVGALQHRAWLAVERAAVLLRKGQFAEAAASAYDASLLARRSGMRHIAAEALTTGGFALLALGRMDEARRASTRARRVARADGGAPLLGAVYTLLGRLAEAEGRCDLASRRYAAAVAQLERERSSVIFEFRGSLAVEKTAAYERLAALQLQAGRPVEALTTVERAKSRALADAIAGRIEIRPRGSAEARHVGRELARAREDYAAAFAQAAREEEVAGGPTVSAQTVSKTLPALESRVADLLHRLQTSAGPDGFAELYGGPAQVMLPSPEAGTILVEFFFSGADIIRLQADCSGVHGENLAGRVSDVERLLRAFHLNLSAAERSEPSRRAQLASQARSLLQALHENLLGGIEGLDTCRSLIVVPHGPLHYLPFQALFDGERYLLEHCAVSYAPSASLYQVCRSRKRQRGGKALVMAHSDGGRLASALLEAEQVAEILGSKAYEDESATRRLLEGEGGRARIIHIAAHGQFRADAPLFSRIELADGPLTTADIFDLDLRAALVTLSACETGRSVVSGGDELDGLARAFLYAGASSLLVSQWRVDDDSTSVLMARFYRELRRGASRAEALRTAQLEDFRSDRALNRGQHPFYWAGFQLIGDDRGMR
jgi:CHAT domain-containing protein